MKKNGAADGNSSERKKKVSNRMVKIEKAMHRVWCCASQMPIGNPRGIASRIR